MPQLMGFSHIDLTVSDCERAAVWWQDPDNMQLELYVHQNYDELPLSDADSAQARQVLGERA